MKKSVLFVFMLYSFLSEAQYVTNPGFEQCIFLGGWYENPESWQTNT